MGQLVGRRSVVALGGLGLATTVFTGCSGSTGGAPAAASSATIVAGPTGSSDGDPSAVASPSGSASPSPSGSTPTLSPSPSASPTSSPSGSAPTLSPSGAPAPGDGLLRRGDSGPQVLAVQQRLTALGYWLGTSDGRYGDLTAQAVTALQKAAGLDRDGVVGPRTRAALDRGVRPAVRSRSGHVVEVDLRHQLLMMVDGGKLTRVLNTSTGSGAYYTAPDGHLAHAVTPPGRYTVFRSVDAWDTSPLGRLYRPRYFNGGIAVHGYPSVPPVPASHGCVRVSLPAMDMIWSQRLMAIGAPVWVY